MEESGIRRTSRVCCAAVAILLGLALQADAQGLHCHGEGQDQSISTDRPTFTNSSTVVPCGSLQLESGLLVSSEQGQRGYDVPEANLRYGLTKTTELRFMAPDYFQNYGSGGSYVTGLGDIGAGVKQSFAATKSGFNLAGIAALTFPTGANEVSSHGYDPALQLMPSQTLPANFTLEGMFSVSWPTQGASRNVTGQSSVVLDWQPRKPADIFFEYNGVFPSRGTPQNTVDFGALYRPTKRQQVDVRGGFGLSAAATDHFFGIGYSVRFDFP
jgi:hypothetical protein